jgi:hypothetical protein
MEGSKILQGIDPQRPFAAAVVIPTILRPTLRRAVESVFAQDMEAPIQILIGVDKSLGCAELLSQLQRICPANRHLTIIDLGYSTSARHGGVHVNHYGGSLRTALSFLANSRYVAYLDDDNWFSPNHVRTLLVAIKRHDWAFSKRWYVHPCDSTPLCVDEWESVGPDAGVYAEDCGGFVDTSTLMLDKLKCAATLHCWSQAYAPGGDGEDRILFKALRKADLRGQGSAVASCYYTLDPKDASHEWRRQLMAQKGVFLEAGVTSPETRYLARPHEPDGIDLLP